MGWASGSSLLSQVWYEVRRFVPESERVDTLAALMVIFSREDCDTLDEVVDDAWPESVPAYEKWHEEMR